MERIDGYVPPINQPDNPLLKEGSEQNSGASILARWEHDVSVASKIHSQFYYEYFNEVDTEFGNEGRNTFDFDFQHDIALSEDNYFNWGLGYRFVASSFTNSKYISANQKHQGLHLINGFFQNKTVFFDDSVQLTFGTKIQYYTLSDWDYHPSVRVLWKIFSGHRVWASFSRATRSPQIGETALNLKLLNTNTQSLVTVFQGNPDFNEEQVYSYELGYRGWLGNRFSLDLAFFYAEYKDLYTALTNQFPATIENRATAKTWGIETAADWRPIDPLRLQISYSFLRVNVDQNSISPQKEREQNDPKHQFSFRGSYDITSAVTFDVWIRYVDSIQALTTFASPARTIDSYVGLDLRLAWKPTSNLELSIIGQNLNNRSHLEYTEEFLAYPKQVERSIYGKIQWGF